MNCVGTWVGVASGRCSSANVLHTGGNGANAATSVCCDFDSKHGNDDERGGPLIKMARCGKMWVTRGGGCTMWADECMCRDRNVDK